MNLARALRLLGQSGEIRRCADTTENEGRDGGPALHLCVGYWIALPMLEKTVLALEPIIRIVPSAMINTTASMTEYSATSWPSSSDHNRLSEWIMFFYWNLHQIAIAGLLAQWLVGGRYRGKGKR